MKARDLTDEQIDDLVDEWHRSGGTDKELYEFLGMSWDEYGLWATNPQEWRRPLTEEERRELTAARAVHFTYSTALIAHEGAPRHLEAIRTIRRLEVRE